VRLVVAVLAIGLGAAPRAAAAPGEGPVSRRGTAAIPTAALAEVSPDLPGLAPLARDLQAVPVDGVAFRQARATYDRAADALLAEQSARVAIDVDATELAARAGRARGDLAAAAARAAGLSARLAEVETAIGDLAVTLYTGDGAAARIDAALATAQPSINDADRRDVLARASLDVLLAERQAYVARLAEAEDRIAAARSATGELEAARAARVAGRAAGVAAEVRRAGPVSEARVAFEEARLLATVVGAEFPLVALNAYVEAAASTAEEAPTCGVRWWAIAGISRVEGHHGSYGGAVLDALGDPSQRIIGIQLNGTNQTRVVPDTDGGALDGDPAYDRAVGPMQFIPQTWRTFAADGNDDGVETPFNLYDATLAAARYLCRASHGLDADPGLRAAYFSYNHSEAYVDRVLSFARLYERTIDLETDAD
jgi:membrane-bound lytic murein transglycosylase B